MTPESDQSPAQPQSQPNDQLSQPSPPSTKNNTTKKSALLWGGIALGLVVLAVVVLLVVIPIFNRSTRTEADPFAVSKNNVVEAAPVSGTVVAVTPSGPNPASNSGTKPLAPGNPSSLPAAVNGATAQVVGRGEFTKIDAIHYARGTVSIGTGTDGKKVLRFENFTSAQGPDLKVYLGTRQDGSLLKEDGLNLGALPATDGSYNISLPDDLDLTKYRSVVIWCEAFGVTFSVASLG